MASCGDLSGLSVVGFYGRVSAFQKIHKREVKFQADIAGAKLK